MKHQLVQGTVNQWGNGLAVRLTKGIAETAGVEIGTPLRIVAEPGRIIFEMVETEPTLDELLAKFDRKKHGGEVMAFEPVGKEVI